MIPQIAEAEAVGSVAAAYATIRALLGSVFVPTIYRMLAVHREAFSIAIDALPETVRIADESNFVERACAIARTQLESIDGAHRTRARLSGGPVPDEIEGLLRGYRAANPQNLLFSLSIVGVHEPEWPNVMSPPLPPANDDIWEDIKDCHGGVLIPGVWRDMHPWPRELERLWHHTRVKALNDALCHAREAVRQFGVHVATETAIESIAQSVQDTLPTSAAKSFAWFPTGVSTMIVEVEWLVADIENLNNERDTHD